MLTLNVSETFYSLQGEGARAGEPSFFIRLQGCKAKHACYASGIRCDTEFESGSARDIEHLVALAKQSGTGWIIWTGGEPLDQLTPEILDRFRTEGFRQAVETSGLHPLDGRRFDWVVVSPKVAEHVVAKNFPDGVDELRYVRHKGQEVPKPFVSAKVYCLSPHFNGQTIDHDNLAHCIELCKANPSWRLSVQLHKLFRIL